MLPSEHPLDLTPCVQGRDKEGQGRLVWGDPASGLLSAPQGSSFSTGKALPAMLSPSRGPRRPVPASEPASPPRSSSMLPTSGAMSSVTLAGCPTRP